MGVAIGAEGFGFETVGAGLAAGVAGGGGIETEGHRMMGDQIFVTEGTEFQAEFTEPSIEQDRIVRVALCGLWIGTPARLCG
jgi:hypothetical protein